jgi:hypothetical protein
MSAPAALDVRVRLLPDPCLWCWEIVDRGGPLIHSSWTAEWTAYASREEALAAGRARLIELWCADAGRTDVDRRRGESAA